MMRILFVDDDAHVLEGLQRLLRPRRREWEMGFVQGGEAALVELSKGAYHVVVTDLRMPGMDGGQLLAEVNRLYPDTVRIMLSGQSDREFLIKTVGLAHQFLSKPCDSDTLKNTIERACGLRAMLKNDFLRRLVSHIDSLPSLPMPYLELLEELHSSTASVHKVGQIIARDMGMTVKILQLVNSAYFGIRQRVSDPAAAASLLGLDIIKALVLSVQVFKQFDQAALQSFSIQDLWAHSISVGAFAQSIARREKQDERFAGDALMAGLLHDVGKLVFATRYPLEWRKALDQSHTQNLPLFDAEREILGATHAELGAYLLGLWGIAYPIVEAVAYHHHPLQAVAPGFGLLTTVYSGNLIDHEIRGDAHALLFDADYLVKIECAQHLNGWRETCKSLEQDQWEYMKKSL